MQRRLPEIFIIIYLFWHLLKPLIKEHLPFRKKKNNPSKLYERFQVGGGLALLLAWHISHSHSFFESTIPKYNIIVWWDLLNLTFWFLDADINVCVRKYMNTVVKRKDTLFAVLHLKVFMHNDTMFCPECFLMLGDDPAFSYLKAFPAGPEIKPS